MNTLVILMLLLPVLGAVLSGSLRRKLSDVSVVVTSGLSLVIALVLIYAVFPQTLVKLVYRLSWIPGLEKVNLFGYLIDPLGMLLLFVVSVLGFVVMLYGTGYIGEGNKEHPSSEGKQRHNFWMMLFIASMIGIAISPNFLQFYIFWEMTTICSWALISHYRNEESLRAGFKALLMTFGGGVFFALAIVLLYVKTGSFEFSALNSLSPGFRTMIFVFFLIAAWAKSAQVPFFTWLPDAMAAPTTVSMYLHAAAMVKAGVFLIARIVVSSYSLSFGAGLLTAVMAVITMLIGVYFFFFQDDLKKLLAYSTITHLAYVLLGLGLGIMGSKIGMKGGILHIINHSAAKGLLFLAVGAVSYATGTRSIRQLSGLGYKMPLVSASFMVGMFSLVGIPPFSCFWSKYFLLMGVIGLGGGVGILLLIPFVLEIIVAFAWFLRVGQKVFFGEVSPVSAEAKKIPWTIKAALIILIILCLAAPLIGLQLVNQI